MSKQKKAQVCSECGRKMERCRAANLDEHGDIVWVCRQCWAKLDYDSYLYEHRKEQ